MKCLRRTGWLGRLALFGFLTASGFTASAQEKPASDSPSSGFFPFNQLGFAATNFWDGNLKGELLLRNGWIDIFDNGLPNQPETAGKAQGATFSYSHDASTGRDSWSAVGAAIYALTYTPNDPKDNNWQGMHFGGLTLAPTLAVNKVQATATNSVDHLYFALAESASWSYSKTAAPLDPKNFVLGLQERIGLVYDTDTSLRARLPGAIFELEPQLFYNFRSNPENTPFPWLSLGWNNVVGELNHGKRALLFQVRTWLHLEGGDIQESGTSWNVVKGSFLRMGPEVRGQITIPALNDLSISAEYDYLPTVSGPAGQNYFYKLNGSLPLIPVTAGTSSKPPISLSVDYSKGGLILSKQPVDLLTVGISLLY